MLNKVHKYLFRANLAVVILGFSTLFYWCCIDGVYINKPLTNYTENVQTTALVYERGDSIDLDWDFCKGTNDVATIRVKIVNGSEIPLDETHGFKLKGCYNTIEEIVRDIPVSVMNGEHKLKIYVSYPRNPLKDVEYRFTTNWFNVVGGEAPDFST